MSRDKYFDKVFLKMAAEKVVEAFISVKVWTIFVFLYLSTYLLLGHYITGDQWCTSNGSIISIVYALREGFKTVKIREATTKADVENVQV